MPAAKWARIGAACIVTRCSWSEHDFRYATLAAQHRDRVNKTSTQYDGTKRATIRAAIFDMDGLLIDSEPLWQDAEIEVFAEVGVALTRAECAETKGRRVDDTVAHWYARRPWSGPRQDEVEARLVDRVAALIALRGVAKPGVEHALRFFRERGCALALATSSGWHVIHAVLARLGLEQAFRVVHSAVEEVAGKPDPAVYLTTAARLGCAPAECVALEDSAHGVAAAKAAGMACIAVPDASSPVPSSDSGLHAADVVRASLLDLNEEIWRRLDTRSRVRVQPSSTN